MIVYKLQCARGHPFEEWFASSSEYDQLAAKQKIPCPQCGDKSVTKALMAPNVASGSKPETAPCGATACASGACPMMGDG